MSFLTFYCDLNPPGKGFLSLSLTIINKKDELLDFILFVKKREKEKTCLIDKNLDFIVFPNMYIMDFIIHEYLQGRDLKLNIPLCFIDNNFMFQKQKHET